MFTNWDAHYNIRTIWIEEDRMVYVQQQEDPPSAEDGLWIFTVANGLIPPASSPTLMPFN